MLGGIGAALRTQWHKSLASVAVMFPALLFFAVVAINCSGDQNAATNPTPPPSVQSTAPPASVQPTIRATSAATTAATVAPTSAAAASYVVKSGDSLGAICAAQRPSMATAACVSAIVDANKLAGPDQLTVGQGLTLPSGASAAGLTSPTPATGSAGQPAAGATAIAATSTSRPTVVTPTPQQSVTGVTITSLTTPVLRGQMATLRAAVPANASCSLSYSTPAGTTSTAAGLGMKTADAAGSVSWTWEIGPGTNSGTGTVKVTCNGVAANSNIVIS